MQEFNQQWQQYLQSKNLAGTKHDCQAYKEYYRTKGLAAFNWEIKPTVIHVNQYATGVQFPDKSVLVISSNRNKKNNNFMRYKPSRKDYCFAERMLFGISAKMPWEV